ncbi:pyridoxamine 5'-phosphate oxidase family protein [Streptomyces sp. DH17]|nr:pyridoxamine 5'-phosphate oxidase family protein [Streptomyces sp. DH17]
MYAVRGAAVARAGQHRREAGRVVVGTLAQAAVLPAVAGYHVDEIAPATGAGWSVTVTGPLDAITDPDEAAHHRAPIPGWTRGPHDTLLRLHPHTVTGFRLAPREK